MECWDFCCPHALSEVASASKKWRVSACCDLLPSPGCPGDEAPAQGPSPPPVPPSSHCSHIPFPRVPAGKGLMLGDQDWKFWSKRGWTEMCTSEPHDSQSGSWPEPRRLQSGGRPCAAAGSRCFSSCMNCSVCCWAVLRTEHSFTTAQHQARLSLLRTEHIFTTAQHRAHLYHCSGLGTALSPLRPGHTFVTAQHRAHLYHCSGFSTPLSLLRTGHTFITTLGLTRGLPDWSSISGCADTLHVPSPFALCHLQREEQSPFHSRDGSHASPAPHQCQPPGPCLCFHLGIPARCYN